jgi:hypothetical protein
LDADGQATAQCALGVFVSKLNYKFFPDDNLTWFFGEGENSLGKVIQKTIEMNSQPEYRTSFDTFFDFGKLIMAFDPDELKRYGEFFKALSSRKNERKWGIYLDDSVTLRTAYMIEKVMEGDLTIHVSRHRAGVLKWLGKPDPKNLVESLEDSEVHHLEDL